MENKNKAYAINLTIGAIENLKAMFFDGPLDDGCVPSKQGRDELVKFGLVSRIQGMNYLTERGMLMAIDAGLPAKKHRLGQEQRIAADGFTALQNSMDVYGIRSSFCNATKHQSEKEGTNGFGTQTSSDTDACASVASQNTKAAAAEIHDLDTKAPSFEFDREVREQTQSLRQIAGTLHTFLEVVSKSLAG